MNLFSFKWKKILNMPNLDQNQEIPNQENPSLSIAKRKNQEKTG